MSARKLTTAQMPSKVTNSKLYATEVEALRQVLNSHADDLDRISVTNEQLGGPFYVKFIHDEEGQGGSLLGLDQRLLCIGAVATVEYANQDGKLYRNQRYYIVFDGSGVPQLYVYLNGYGTGPRTVAAKWVREGSEEAAQAITANVPLLDPAKKDYPAGYLVRQPYNGFDYLLKTVAAGGPFPAPASYQGNGDWDPVALPTPPTVLSLSLPLGYVQGVVLRQNGVHAGVLYQLPGDWNATGTTQTVEVHGGQGGFAAFGTLVDGATRTAVAVDVAAGTFAPLGGVSEAELSAAVAALVDNAPAALNTLGKLAGQILANQQQAGVILDILQQVQALSQQQQQRLDALLAGADSSVDTFIEVFNRFMANEGVATALTGQLDKLQQVQATHTQQLAANAGFIGTLANLLSAAKSDLVSAFNELWGRVFGRYRGQWAASTDYVKYDLITRPDTGNLAAANATFTSGASFVAANWTDVLAGQSAIYGLTAVGAKRGYATLNAAVKDTSSTCFSWSLQVATAGITTGAYSSNLVWPTYLFGNGATVTLIDNLTLITPFSALVQQLTLTYRNGFTSSNSTLTVRGGTDGTERSAARLVQVNSVFDIVISQVVVLTDSNVGRLLGTGTAILYAGSSYDEANSDFSQGLTVIDRRPGASGGGGGPTYTAGTGIAISAQNVISATGGTSIDYANLLTLDQATALQVNKAYYLTGSGYALTLPASTGDTRNAIFLAAAKNATGVYAVTGASLNLYPSETMILRDSPDGWRKTGGDGNTSHNGTTLFKGSTGRFSDATSSVSYPANGFYFTPMQDRPIDPFSQWDETTHTYRITIPGTYLITTKVLPAQGTQNGFTGRDFYCGPTVGSPADSDDGNWEQVSSTSRRAIKIATLMHCAAGVPVGNAHYQENGGWPALSSMTIVLLKAD